MDAVVSTDTEADVFRVYAGTQIGAVVVQVTAGISSGELDAR